MLWGRSRIIASKIGTRITTQQRNAGGWINKNIHAEENAGLREASYKTWEFDKDSLPQLVGLLILPSMLFYYVCIAEFVSIYFYI